MTRSSRSSTSWRMAHTIEVAVFGREGVSGLLSALVTREAFGRYIVQMAGTASRIPSSA